MTMFEENLKTYSWSSVSQKLNDVDNHQNTAQEDLFTYSSSNVSHETKDLNQHIWKSVKTQRSKHIIFP